MHENRATDGRAGFFSQEVWAMSTPDRSSMLERDHLTLSIRGQCRLLGIARWGVYRTTPVSDVDLALMQRIDELFVAWPFLGSRLLTAMLRADGLTINRKRVQRLMRLMGIAAFGPKPRTTKPTPGHKIFPYLLRDLVIDRPNQVWAADITYIPIGRGFLYLVAIIDWASRAVLAWRLSNTMDIAVCVDALDEALARFGRPEIFNTDQGSQFTSAAFAGRLGERRHPDLARRHFNCWIRISQRGHRAGRQSRAPPDDRSSPAVNISDLKICLLVGSGWELTNKGQHCDEYATG
jgi:putative transposase